MKDKIEQYVEELQHTCVVAGLNYEIWWLYKEKESRKRFVDTLNDYPLFFQTSLHAHFVAMIIALYRFFETRHDTVNFPGLIKLLKKDGSITQADLKKFESKINQAKILWRKVSVLRNNLFGHKATTLDNDGIWKKACLTPNQLRDLINDCKRLLNMITAAWNRSSHAFNLSAAEDTKRLLEDLKRLNEEKL